jgi:hypothetical protein
MIFLFTCVAYFPFQNQTGRLVLNETRLILQCYPFDKIVHFCQTNLQNLEVQEEDISTEISSVRSTFLSKIEDVEGNITTLV